MSAVLLIARREVTTRLRRKAYRISILVILVLVVLACVIPSFFGGGGSSVTTYQVGVATDAPGLTAALEQVVHAQGDRVQVHTSSVAQVEAKVHSGDWDAGVLPGNRLLVEHASDDVVRIVQSAVVLSGTVDRLKAAGLSDSQIAQALTVRPLSVRTTASSANTQRQVTAIIAVVALFTQLIMFTTWMAMGVVEEKASRVVELIVSAVRPRQLLLGKLLGIGTVAAGQTLLLGTTAVAAGTAAGTIPLPASAIWTVLVAFVGFLLGFVFFASLGAALASTVSRQEEVSGVLAPATLLLGASYGLSFATANAPGSTFARVLSIVPPVSAISMPARIARGGVPALDIVVAVVLLVIVAVAILLLAGRIYRASVLHSGTRVSLRRAWRGEAVAAHK